MSLKSHGLYIVRGFVSDLDGIICPSEIVYDLLVDINRSRKTGGPTGIELVAERPISREDIKSCVSS